VSDDNTFVGQRVGDQPVDCNLKECRNGGGLIVLTRRPRADRTECWQNGVIGCGKERLATRRSPVRQIVATTYQFVADFLDTAVTPRALLPSLGPLVSRVSRPSRVRRAGGPGRV